MPLDLKAIAAALQDAADNTFAGKTMLTYTKEPELSERDIIEYHGRLRIFGMEKFNGPCCITVVNFYRSPADKEKHSAWGALVIYFEDENTDKLLKAMGHKIKADAEEEVVLENCAQFSKNLAESFVGGLKGKGYPELILGEPLKYRNHVLEGVEFNYKEYKLYQLNFYMWKKKVLAMDITLPPGP